MAEIIGDGTGNGYKAGVDINNNVYIIQPTDRLIQKMAYNANGMVEYIGLAAPGSSAGSTVWQIKKLTYDSNLRVTDIQFASGTTNFDKEWDERATYSYS